jgi:hypothetical protein
MCDGGQLDGSASRCSAERDGLSARQPGSATDPRGREWHVALGSNPSPLLFEQGGYYYNDLTGFVGMVVRANGKIFVAFRGTDMAGGFNNLFTDLKSMVLGSGETAGTVDINDFTPQTFGSARALRQERSSMMRSR